ncbi:MAG: c-type cytochrome domain-containing protein, partial [Verrucomicrobiota bacterium]
MIILAFLAGALQAAGDGSAFFESNIRPILVERCYDCHSEMAGERKGGLLLDRRTGWMEGGDTDKAVVPGQPESSLLIAAIRYGDKDLQMPPKMAMPEEEILLLEEWIRRGAPGPKTYLGATSFSQLGDQDVLFEKAAAHWAFQPVQAVDPPYVEDP